MASQSNPPLNKEGPQNPVMQGKALGRVSKDTLVPSRTCQGIGQVFGDSMQFVRCTAQVVGSDSESSQNRKICVQARHFIVLFNMLAFSV